jgi:hypothetical protein
MPPPTILTSNGCIKVFLVISCNLFSVLLYTHCYSTPAIDVLFVQPEKNRKALTTAQKSGILRALFGKYPE